MIQNNSFPTFQLDPSVAKASMRFCSRRKFFEAFSFPWPSNALIVSQLFHGCSPNSAVQTSRPSAAASLVMSTSLTDDLDPRLMNMLLFASWHNPRQMMKTSVSSVMQINPGVVSAACFACSKIRVSASYCVDWRSSIYCQPLSVSLMHLSLEVTNMHFRPSFSRNFCSFQLSARKAVNLFFLSGHDRSRLQFLILWPGMMLLNAIPSVEPRWMRSADLIESEWYTSNTTSILSLPWPA